MSGEHPCSRTRSAVLSGCTVGTHGVSRRKLSAADRESEQPAVLAPVAPSDWERRLDRRRAAVPAASRRRCPPHRQIDPDHGAALGVPPRRGPDEALGTRGREGMMSERVLVLDGRTIEALACVRSLGRAGYWVAVAGKLRL